MKKLLLALLPASLLLASCSNDSHPSNSMTMRATLPTVIIPTDESKPAVFAGLTDYLLTQSYVEATWTIAAALEAPGYGTNQFLTPSMAGSGTQNFVEIGYYTPFTSKTGQTFSYLSAKITDSYYWHTNENTIYNRPLGYLIYMQYAVKDMYVVKSFPEDVCYGGTTQTVAGETEFNTSLPTYLVQLDVASGTAEVVIFSAQFSSQMPILSRVTIKGLKLTPSRECGYVISGENIIPTVGEGPSATPYPQFPFTKFELRPSSPDLTTADITYTVAGKYQGTLAGKVFKDANQQ